HHQHKGRVLGILHITDDGADCRDNLDPLYRRDLMRDGDGHAAAAKAGIGENTVGPRPRRHVVEGGVQPDHQPEQSEGHRHRKQSEDHAHRLAHYRGPDEREVSHQLALRASTTGRRAARMEGNSPPSSATAMAQVTPSWICAGETERWKTALPKTPG